MNDSLDTSEHEARPWLKPAQPPLGDGDPTVATKEEQALGAFLAAMHDCDLDGGKMREAMIEALGLAGQQERINQLTEEIRVSDQLLARHNKVLAAIPECPAHGGQCIPHALEWIEKAKSSKLEPQVPSGDFEGVKVMLLADTIYGEPELHAQQDANRVNADHVLYLRSVTDRKRIRFADDGSVSFGPFEDDLVADGWVKVDDRPHSTERVRLCVDGRVLYQLTIGQFWMKS